MVHKCRGIVSIAGGAGVFSADIWRHQRYRVREPYVRVLLQVGRLPTREWLQDREKRCVGISDGRDKLEARRAASAQGMSLSTSGRLCNRRACTGGRDTTFAEGKAFDRRVGRAGNADRITWNEGPQS